MTTRTDRMRQHLERHGYRVSHTTATVDGHRFDSEEAWLIGPDGALFASTNGQPGWDNALAYFLQDASKTGARIRDIADDGVNGPNGRGGQMSAACADYNPDEAFADLWRRVFIDPEDNQ